MVHFHAVDSAFAGGACQNPTWRLSPQFSIVHLVLGSVGCYEGVGEDGLGFGQQVLGLFESGADMGEQQLFGMGLLGQGGGLCGCAVQFLFGHAGESIVEGAL